MALGGLVVSLSLQHQKYMRGLDQADQRALKFADKQQKNFDRVKKSSFGALGAVKGLIGAYAGFRGIQGLISLSDQHTKLTAQLKLATQTQEEYNQAYQSTIRIANQAQAAIEPVAQLYARVSKATREMGANQASVATITEATALGLKVSGATAEESASAILQLSQAMGSGVLRVEEFNAVNEAAPRIMQALAESLNVPIGQLRDMAKEGLLTADVVGNSLIDSLEQLRKEAEETQTIAGTFTVIKNRLSLLVGEFMAATNASSGMASAFKWMGDLAYDVARGSLQFLGSIVIRLVAGFKNIGVAGVGVFEAIKRAANFDFSGANSALSDMWSEMGKNKREANDLIKKLHSIDITTEQATQTANRLHKPFGVAEEAAKKTAKATKKISEAAKAAKKAIDDQKNAIVSIQERAQALAFEEATLGMMPSAITEITIARKQDQKAALEAANQNTKLITQEIEALEALRDVQSGKEYRKQLAERKKLKEKEAKEDLARAKKLQEKQQSEWLRSLKEQRDAAERETESFINSATDSIFRLLEGGASFGETIKESILNATKGLVIKPIVQAVITGTGLAGFANGSFAKGIQNTIGNFTSNLFGGEASADGGIDLTSLGTIYKGITKGFDAVNIGFSQSIADVGSFLVDKGFDKLGSAIWTNSTTIASAMPYVGAAVQALSGDVRGGAFTAAGAAIGSVIPGIGTVIGAAIGSLIGSLTGGKEQPPRSLGYVRTTVQDGEINSGWHDPSLRRHTPVGAITEALKQPSEFVASIISALSLSNGGSGNVSLDTRYSGRDGGSSYKSILGSIDGLDFGVQLHRGKFGEDDLQAYLTALTGTHLATIIQQLELPDQVKSVFAGVVDPEVITNLTGAVTALNNSQDVLVDKFGLTASNVYQISEQLQITGGAFAQFTNDLIGAASGLAKVSEQILGIKQSVTDALTFFPNVASLTEYDAFIKETSESGNVGASGLLLGARAGVSQYFSLLEQTKDTAAASVFGLRSTDAQQSLKQAEVDGLFGQFGLSIPQSASELVAIADSIDYTTEAGLDLAVAMPSLVEAFTDLNGSIGTTTAQLRALKSEDFDNVYDFNYAKQKQSQGEQLDGAPRFFENSTSPTVVTNNAEEITVLKAEIQDRKAENIAMVSALTRMEAIFDKWDALGITINEENADGDPLVLKTEAA